MTTGMDKLDFYRRKSVASVEWWLHECDFPSLRWARLRVFDDGTADACWQAGTKLHGFATREFAANFLLEDEYARLAGLTSEDLDEHELDASVLVPPEWTDTVDQAFEYLGTY